MKHGVNVTPGPNRYTEATAATNAQYNAWAQQRPPYTQREREWRKAKK